MASWLLPYIELHDAEITMDALQSETLSNGKQS